VDSVTTKTEPVVEKPEQPTPTKPESTQQDDVPQYFELPTYSGGKVAVTEQQLIELAKLGHSKLEEDSKKSAPVTTPEDDDDTEPDIKAQLAALNKEHQDFKRSVENERTQNQVKMQLENSLNQLDIIKEDPDLKAPMSLLALAIQQTQPQYNIADATKIAAKQISGIYTRALTKAQEQAKVNKTVSNQMNGILRSEGGVPTLDKEKKFTPDDVRSGVSQRLMQEILNGAEN